ncbi:hypothetical protein DFH09DRAFT_1225156 [Mycena vulgaris]|nr:hypothetical protein DFH09DRAFT_1225156 [Mycena vulgaris]
MALVSDHHHQKPKPPGDLPPRAAGSVHPRPHDDTASDSSPERPAHPLVVKSPHSRRILKQPRTEAPLEPIDYANPAQTPLPRATDTLPVEDPMESPPSPPPHFWETREYDLIAQMIDLTGQASALLNELRETYDMPLRGLAHHIRDFYQRLGVPCDDIPAPLPPAIPTATYASVATPRVTRADPHPHKKKRPTQPSSTPRRQSRSSPHRLILRWTVSPPAITQRTSVTAMTAVLDDATFERHSPSHIQGVNWTSNGNLVIHTRAPYTASQLKSLHGDAVVEIVKRECGFTGPAVLEADSPWVQLVVHGVPAQPLVTSLEFEQEEFWTALESTGNGPAEVKAIRLLCRNEELETRERLSLRLTFGDANAANRMLSSGAFFFGTHCRVSRYRPRSKSRSLS